MPRLAVVDVETTGINPWQHDRIVELAAVVVEDNGTTVREFVSLVNPERDIGPMSIHGLCSEDVLGAPRFAEIAGALIETVGDCVALAGHNVRFDQSFLAAEFERLGLAFPEIPQLCTLQMAGGGNLGDCCDAYDIQFDDGMHEALKDARATARLLSVLLNDLNDARNELATFLPIHRSPARMSHFNRLFARSDRYNGGEGPDSADSSRFSANNGSQNWLANPVFENTECRES